MDNELFIKLLSNHNRLTVPSFGTFLKKEQAGAEIIVFTPFLKTDDGIITSAISDNLGVSSDEAAIIVREYVDEIKSCLSKSGRFHIEGLGILKHDMNGAISFIYEPKVIKEEPVVQQPVAVAEEVPIVTQPIAVEEVPIVQQPIVAKQETMQVPVAEPTKIQQTPPVQHAAPRPAAPVNRAPQPMPISKSPLAAAPRPVSPAPRPINRRPAPTAEQRPRQPVKKTPGKFKNLPKTDIWLLVAIIAAVLVIALIIYGTLNQDPEIILNPDIPEMVTDSVAQVVK